MELKDKEISLTYKQEFSFEKSAPAILSLIAQKEGEWKVFILGDSDFISKTSAIPVNSVFFMNVIDSFTLWDDLISIRSKNIIDRPIQELSEQGKNLIKYWNIFWISFIFILLGLIRFYLRKKKAILK